MGLSNKAINKFAKFTATKPPLYKQKAVLKISKKQDLVKQIREKAATKK